jgi:hypothetical protein
MSNIDKQRIAAVRKLEAMGYVFHEHDWTGPAIPAASWRQSGLRHRRH